MSNAVRHQSFVVFSPNGPNVEMMRNSFSNSPDGKEDGCADRVGAVEGTNERDGSEDGLILILGLAEGTNEMDGSEDGTIVTLGTELGTELGSELYSVCSYIFAIPSKNPPTLAEASKPGLPMRIDFPSESMATLVPDFSPEVPPSIS